MSPIEKLAEVLQRDGLNVTLEQARKMAIRLSGSVEVYLAESLEAQKLADNPQPNTGPCSDKFSEDLNPELEPPSQPGASDRDS